MQMSTLLNGLMLHQSYLWGYTACLSNFADHGAHLQVLTVVVACGPTERLISLLYAIGFPSPLLLNVPKPQTPLYRLAFVIGLTAPLSYLE